MTELFRWVGLPFSWMRDLLDILVVTLVAYRVILMMRGTRGAQVLIGLFVILIAYIFSQTFELVTLNWMMTHFVNNLFLILVVLFQNEIRRALAQVGRGPFFGGADQAVATRTVEEIVRATSRLAQRRTGALIVIAQRTALGTVIESGVRLDAMVSHQLLESIFAPTTPLHDGAVVIDGPNVVAAGCVLPLATEGELPREFGTRHRAALGMSQDSDATVIIVSEERGLLSVARHGGILFNVKPEELRSELQQLFRSGQAGTQTS